MKLYEVMTEDEYLDVIMSTLKTGAEEYMGCDVPLFTDYTELIDFFLGLSDEFYDEDGEPLFENDNEFRELFRKYLPERVSNLEFDYPFYVAIAGEFGCDRLGDFESRTFYELKPEKLNRKD